MRWSRPFLILWGAWHVLWFAGLLWVTWALPDYTRVYFAALYTIFWPLELAGVRLKYDKRDGLARTLSEVRQFLPVTQGRGHAMVGWKVLGYSGVIDALIVGWILYPFNSIVAATFSCIVAILLVPHFGVRERVG